MLRWGVLALPKEVCDLRTHARSVSILYFFVFGELTPHDPSEFLVTPWFLKPTSYTEPFRNYFE